MLLRADCRASECSLRSVARCVDARSHVVSARRAVRLSVDVNKMLKCRMTASPAIVGEQRKMRGIKTEVESHSEGSERLTDGYVPLCLVGEVIGMRRG